jgi:large subunit ribosomal protein L21
MLRLVKTGVVIQFRLVSLSVLTSCLSPAVAFSRARPAFRQLQTSAPRPTITANSVAEALELIRSQPSHYVRATLAGRELILTPRDLVTLPRLNDVNVGDVLTLDAVTELGSREYTIRGNPYIPTQLATVSATVVEHTMGKMEEIFKKKRRKGYQRTIKHKQTYTRLRIGDIQVHPPETILES